MPRLGVGAFVYAVNAKERRGEDASLLGGLRWADGYLAGVVSLAVENGGDRHLGANAERLNGGQGSRVEGDVVSAIIGLIGHRQGATVKIEVGDRAGEEEARPRPRNDGNFTRHAEPALIPCREELYRHQGSGH